MAARQVTRRPRRLSNPPPGQSAQSGECSRQLGRAHPCHPVGSVCGGFAANGIWTVHEQPFMMVPSITTLHLVGCTAYRRRRTWTSRTRSIVPPSRRTGRSSAMRAGYEARPRPCCLDGGESVDQQDRVDRAVESLHQTALGHALSSDTSALIDRARRWKESHLVIADRAIR